MKKIVDINYLTDPNLEDFLSKSQDNFVIFTDFACMECLKDNAHKSLRCKFAIVSRHPKQVIILKGTREIVRLTLSSDKIPQCLIDMEQTVEFPEFCRQVLSENNPLLSNDLLFKQNIASKYIEGLENGHELIVEGVKGFSKSHAPSHMKSLRRDESPPEDFMVDITDNIIHTAIIMCEKHPDIEYTPDTQSIKTSYLFRYIASAYFLSLEWIKKGGLDSVTKKKLRNDYIDMSYVAYATYFDGLFSNDKKTNDIYQRIMPYLDWANS